MLFPLRTRVLIIQVINKDIGKSHDRQLILRR